MKEMIVVVGMIIPVGITLISMLADGNNSLRGLNFGHYVLFLVLGILISLTQIIPGLSATVLLMMFGYYTAILEGVGTELFTDFGLLLVYLMLGLGFVIGILLFSKVINRLLEKQRTPFFFTICGLSIGSMVAVFLGNECMDIYKAWENMARDLIVGIIALAAGFAITFALYLYDKKKEQKKLAEEKN